MELADLLVSYKQVLPDDSDYEEVELPMDKYQRMILYINTKEKELSSEKEEVPELSTPTQSSDDFGFNGWDYSNISTDSTLNPSTLITFKSNSDWANQLSNSYRKLGLSENAIKNLIAKNALESGWGKSTLGKYNYGNITTGKYWNGDYVEGNDHDASGKVIKQKFRSYKSLDDFTKDEFGFLTKLYYFNPDDDFETFANKLLGKNKAGRKYAEAPNYIDRLRKVYDNLN